MNTKENIQQLKNSSLFKELLKSGTINLAIFESMNTVECELFAETIIAIEGNKDVRNDDMLKQLIENRIKSDNTLDINGMLNDLNKEFNHNINREIEKCVEKFANNEDPSNGCTEAFRVINAGLEKVYSVACSAVGETISSEIEVAGVDQLLSIWQQ